MQIILLEMVKEMPAILTAFALVIGALGTCLTAYLSYRNGKKSDQIHGLVNGNQARLDDERITTARETRQAALVASEKTSEAVLAASKAATAAALINTKLVDDMRQQLATAQSQILRNMEAIARATPLSVPTPVVVVNSVDAPAPVEQAAP